MLSLLAPQMIFRFPRHLDLYSIYEDVPLHKEPTETDGVVQRESLTPTGVVPYCRTLY